MPSGSRHESDFQMPCSSDLRSPRLAYAILGIAGNYDGNVIQQGQRNPWEIVTAELFPRLVDKARENWSLENNIFNVGARGYVGKPGGETANYLTWVRDLAEGKYKLPWHDSIRIKDGWKYYPEGVKLGSLPKKANAK
jgi:formamidase